MVQSADERRAAARERMRAKRAAERAEREAVAANGANDGPVSTVMRDAVDEALAAMKWLVASDGASVAQARMLARTVDETEHRGELTKSLSAQRALSRVLTDLGGTPTVRMQHELRSLRAAAKDPEVPDDDDEASEPSNVVPIKRPAGRRQSG